MTVHDPTDTCAKVHCHGCGQDHPQQRAWLWCFECGHPWTPRELRRAYRRALTSDIRWRERPWWRSNEWHDSIVRVLWRVATARARNIHFCQLCLHDF